jgi:uncharacterized protein YcfL
MMNTRSTFVLLLGALFSLAGCNSQVSNPNIRQYAQDTVNVENPRARLVIADPRLVGKIALVDARVGQAGQLARGEVSVQNLSSDTYRLEYLFAWEDNQGFKTPGNRAWQPLTLGPREIVSLPSVAKSPEAYAYTLTVRPVVDMFPPDLPRERNSSQSVN